MPPKRFSGTIHWPPNNGGDNDADASSESQAEAEYVRKPDTVDEWKSELRERITELEKQAARDKTKEPELLAAEESMRQLEKEQAKGRGMVYGIPKVVGRSLEQETVRWASAEKELSRNKTKNKVKDALILRQRMAIRATNTAAQEGIKQRRATLQALESGARTNSATSKELERIGPRLEREIRQLEQSIRPIPEWRDSDPKNVVLQFFKSRMEPFKEALRNIPADERKNKLEAAKFCMNDALVLAESVSKAATVAEEGKLQRKLEDTYARFERLYNSVVPKPVKTEEEEPLETEKKAATIKPTVQFQTSEFNKSYGTPNVRVTWKDLPQQPSIEQDTAAPDLREPKAGLEGEPRDPSEEMLGNGAVPSTAEPQQAQAAEAAPGEDSMRAEALPQRPPEKGALTSQEGPIDVEALFAGRTIEEASQAILNEVERFYDQTIGRLRRIVPQHREFSQLRGDIGYLARDLAMVGNPKEQEKLIASIRKQVTAMNALGREMAKFTDDPQHYDKWEPYMRLNPKPLDVDALLASGNDAEAAKAIMREADTFYDTSTVMGKLYIMPHHQELGAHYRNIQSLARDLAEAKPENRDEIVSKIREAAAAMNALGPVIANAIAESAELRKLYPDMAAKVAEETYKKEQGKAEQPKKKGFFRRVSTWLGIGGAAAAAAVGISQMDRSAPESPTTPTASAPKGGGGGGSAPEAQAEITAPEAQAGDVEVSPAPGQGADRLFMALKEAVSKRYGAQSNIPAVRAILDSEPAPLASDLGFSKPGYSRLMFTGDRLTIDSNGQLVFYDSLPRDERLRRTVLIDSQGKMTKVGGLLVPDRAAAPAPRAQTTFQRGTPRLATEPQEAPGQSSTAETVTPPPIYVPPTDMEVAPNAGPTVAPVPPIETGTAANPAPGSVGVPEAATQVPPTAGPVAVPVPPIETEGKVVGPVPGPVEAPVVGATPPAAGPAPVERVVPETPPTPPESRSRPSPEASADTITNRDGLVIDQRVATTYQGRGNNNFIVRGGSGDEQISEMERFLSRPGNRGKNVYVTGTILDSESGMPMVSLFTTDSQGTIIYRGVVRAPNGVAVRPPTPDDLVRRAP